MSKTGEGLAQYARAQIGRPYWWGTFGQIADAELLAAKRQQYPAYYTAADFPRQYGKKVHDCVGLIKGYLWCAGPDAEPIYRASQDVAVGGLYLVCREHGNMGTMPDEPGVCVFMSDLSHVGVYVGGGEVVEATGHARGVVQSKLAGRGWAYWGKPKWISYTGKTEATTPTQPATTTPTASAGLTVTGLPVLRTGSESESVRSAQLLLIGRGYDCGPDRDDGEFGANTRKAVEKFQSAHGLEADGVVGPRTWARLIGG